ncbi:MAG: bifunctional 3-hydroxydecanoyl-ACP dehydratase/trans-2-decenoyl-ACP isomerase [Myxococcales bacterium]|nr:MAG: bifunctional 3-hydroxydecanoyl-ACP dehydratase/trans-2-decenoyl-ACP isomerase [Myxococcales bacterium]
MKYDEFRARQRFEQSELLAFGHGTLVDDPPEGFTARLPVPPMLMLDRVVEISRQGNRGRVVGERDVKLDDWFFQCHFLGDPVQPGCLGVDAVWQLLGFFCNWAGGLGSGRALGCGEIEFFGQIRPHDRLVRVEIDVRRYTELPESGSAIAIGDATLLVDGEPIYSVKRAKTGLFRNIAYHGYPNATERSRGGRMER